MPLPKPRDDESQDKFFARCIPATIQDQDLDPDNEGDREQATAICGSQWREVKGNTASQEIGFACNVTSADVRTETWEGREWLVAPVVALTSGVRNGELVPASEVTSHPKAWNGRPIVLYHPSQNGRHISANDPALLEKQQIGQLFGVQAARDGDQAKLKGELWIDIAKAQKVGADGLEVLNRLRSRSPLEVSTAYFRDVIATQGLFDGIEFGSEARDIKPDHLAVLPNGTGACSWADGCGAPRVNQNQDLAGANENQSVKEDKMDELITRIVEDGRLGFNAEDLEERAEGELRGMLAALEAMPVQEPEEDEEEAADQEPVANAEPEPETEPESAPEAAPEQDPRLAALLATVEKLGGVQALENTVRDYQNTVTARRNRMINTLAANAACTFEKDQLERMDEDQLIALDRMMTPVDYTGMGANAVREGEEELAMPQIEWTA